MQFIIKRKKIVAAAAFVICLIIACGVIYGDNYRDDTCTLQSASLKINGINYNMDSKSHSFSKNLTMIETMEATVEIAGENCGKGRSPYKGQDEHPISIYYSYDDSADPNLWINAGQRKASSINEFLANYFEKIDMTGKNNLYIKIILGEKNYFDRQVQASEVKQIHLYRELSTPVISQATSSNDYSAKLTWSKDVAANGYEIYMSASKTSGYKLLADVSTATTSYTAKELKANKNYYFKIKSYSSGSGKKIYSDFGGVKTVKTKKAKIADVKSIKAKNSFSKSAKLTWKKTKKAKGYVVYMSSEKNGKYKKIKSIKGANKLTYTKKSLKKGKTYYFKVKAYTKVKGKTYYSNSSKIVKIKIKK